MKKILLLAVISTIIVNLSFAQSAVIRYKGHSNYSFTERSDLRLYINGKYAGLQSKQVGAFIIPSQSDSGLVYEGDFYVNQDTSRNQILVAEGIHNAIFSSFKIDKDGRLTMLQDNGYPSFRSFPAYSAQNIKKGDTWQSQAIRAVDPLSKGIITKMPIYVQYTYTGDDYFNGEAVFLISAQWATRYGMNSTTHYIDWGGDKELEKAVGSHKATIIVSKKSGAALVIRDNVDETFYYSNGNFYQFKGTISLFTEYPPAIDRSKIIDAIKRIIKLDDEEADSLRNPLEEEDFTESINASENSLSNQLAKADLQSEKKESGKLYDDENWEKLSVKDTNPPAWEKINDDEIYNPPLKEKADKKEELAKKVEESLKKDYKNKEDKNEQRSIAVENTDAGIRLTMKNLQFKADSSELLKGEELRLNQIAEILKAAEGCKFLIEGHTASTGNERGEMKLSMERAMSIANALEKRGISKERFICKGSGGRKPIAENTSAEGKAKNRRVEITILEGF